jgi:hypothetical protein
MMSTSYLLGEVMPLSQMPLNTYKYQRDHNLCNIIHLIYLGDDESCDDQVGSTTTITNTLDPYDHIYQNIPDSTHKLEPKPDCKHCGAKRFQYELDGFCCRSGKIKLAHSEPPLELQRLYTSLDPDAVHFRDNIRYFNGYFSFTTLGVSLDDKYTNMKSGVHTIVFKAR